MECGGAYWGIIAGIVIGGPAVYKLATKPNFVIKDIQVPSDLSDRGFTGDVIAQQILDHIAEIDRIGGSKKEKAAISGFDLESSMPSIQLPVGGFNLNAVVAEVRQLLGVTETKVTGEIYTAVAADDESQASEIIEQVHAGLDVLKCFRGVWSETLKEDGVWFTHTVSKFQDLEE